jgi:HEPN domain-containing protein
MTPMTAEWVRKAEGDYGVVSVLLRSRKKGRYDAVCFHAQQCVEKYLKARMVESVIAFSKTHDLEVLLNLVTPSEPLWTVFAQAFRKLTEWAVLPRYPGKDATSGDAREAVKICRKFRGVARQALGLNP